MPRTEQGHKRMRSPGVKATGSVRGPGSVRCARLPAGGVVRSGQRRRRGAGGAADGRPPRGGGDPRGGRTGEVGGGVRGPGGPGGKRPAGSHVSWEPRRRAGQLGAAAAGGGAPSALRARPAFRLGAQTGSEATPTPLRAGRKSTRCKDFFQATPSE